MGVDTFVIKAGAAGPFLGATPFAEADLARSPLRPASRPRPHWPVRRRRSWTARQGETSPCSGRRSADRACRSMSEGRAPSTPDEVAVSSTLGRHVGDELRVGARTLRIVGIVPNSTALAKTPNIFLTTEGVQHLAYNGQPIDLVDRDQGHTRSNSRTATRLVDRAAGVNDLLRPVKVACGFDHDRGCVDVDRGGADRRVGGLPLRARAPARLRGVQGDRRADAVDPGGARAAGDRRRAARGRAGRRLFAAARPVVPDDCRGALPLPTWRYRWSRS